MKPADSNWMYGTQAHAVAVQATAHNSGETVLETKVEGDMVSLKMSSWPRAKEAEKAFHAAGWQTRFGANDMGQWIDTRPNT